MMLKKSSRYMGYQMHFSTPSPKKVVDIWATRCTFQPQAQKTATKKLSISKLTIIIKKQKISHAFAKKAKELYYRSL